jgi:hypothetical protein
MTQMESEIVNALNTYYKSRNISAEAYRLNQSFVVDKNGVPQTGQPQKIDIISDSINPNYYLGIECKSVDLKNGTKVFNFKSRFSSSSGGFQLIREHNFCRRTGRYGVLAVELRGVTKRELYLLPLDYVYETYKNDSPGIKITRIRQFPSVERVKGKYLIDEEFFTKIREKYLSEPLYIQKEREKRGERTIRKLLEKENKIKEEEFNFDEDILNIGEPLEFEEEGENEDIIG